LFRFSVIQFVHAASICSSLKKVLRTYPNTIRSFLFLIALSVWLSASLGCHKKLTPPVLGPQKAAPNQPAEPAPQAITPTVIPPSKPEPVEPEPAPVAVAAPSSLEMGDTSFKAGDYAKAARFYEDFYKTGTKSENKDKALFFLGLSRALSNNPSKNMHRMEETLRRLVSEFPSSPYRVPSELVLGLQAQVDSLQSDIKEKEAKIKQLSDELQRLKEIDMQRRPSRPPD
jgi:hypothetical protein